MICFSQKHYYDGFEAKFGFTLETLKDGLWPGKEEAGKLIANMNMIYPGLAYKKDKKGVIVETPLAEALIVKINNDRQTKRNALRKHMRRK